MGGSVGIAKGAKVGGEVGLGVHLSHVRGQASLSPGRDSQTCINNGQGSVFEPNVKPAESWHDPFVVGEKLGAWLGEMVGKVARHGVPLSSRPWLQQSSSSFSHGTTSLRHRNGAEYILKSFATVSSASSCFLIDSCVQSDI